MDMPEVRITFPKHSIKTVVEQVENALLKYCLNHLITVTLIWCIFLFKWRVNKCVLLKVWTR